MFVPIKTQVENSRIPESGFTLDKIMRLHINIYRLVLTGGALLCPIVGGRGGRGGKLQIFGKLNPQVY